MLTFYSRGFHPAFQSGPKRVGPNVATVDRFLQARKGLPLYSDAHTVFGDECTNPTLI
jgi:hypothetical protein